MVDQTVGELLKDPVADAPLRPVLLAAGFEADYDALASIPWG